MIGFLGGFTTFSSFGLQTFTLLRDGEFWFATLNIVGSNFLGPVDGLGGLHVGQIGLSMSDKLQFVFGHSFRRRSSKHPGQQICTGVATTN